MPVLRNPRLATRKHQHRQPAIRTSHLISLLIIPIELPISSSFLPSQIITTSEPASHSFMTTRQVSCSISVARWDLQHAITPYVDKSSWIPNHALARNPDRVHACRRSSISSLGCRRQTLEPFKKLVRSLKHVSVISFIMMISGGLVKHPSFYTNHAGLPARPTSYSGKVDGQTSIATPLHCQCFCLVVP